MNNLQSNPYARPIPHFQYWKLDRLQLAKARLGEMTNVVIAKGISRQSRFCASLSSSAWEAIELVKAQKNARRAIRVGQSVERVKRAELRLARAVIAFYRVTQ